MSRTDTIFALSSGRPPAAIAVVRVSGPRAADAITALGGRLPEPRRAALRRLRHDGALIDEALVLWFPGPATETAEDMVELHLHGGRAVVAAVLAALGTLPGFRPAEAGEFTRRAFANGRLDLTAVEGLADLVFAETEAQRAQAMRQFSGALGGRADAWRSRLIEALALIEARIDFSDQDVPDDLVSPALYVARELVEEIGKTLVDEHRGERLREGLTVAIAGPPNAGKSSLLNRLARREAAIVSPYAGTTRDVIEVHLDLGGYPVTLLDTAGVRESDDPVEQEGVRRAKARAEAADLVLWVMEAGSPEGAVGWAQRGVPTTVPRNNEMKSKWIIHNKADLSPDRAQLKDQDHKYSISALTGQGLENLVSDLAAFAREAFSGGEPALVTRERHRVALRETVDALSRALAIGVSGGEELIAEELRLATRALGRLTGRVDVEDVLDVIFRDFCIGK
ncbi:MAG: tRNA uridine-5-carboxymethylaminomethyl(34) synthesis GTPase MnmE [Alphaproteobacteria bacterium]